MTRLVAPRSSRRGILLVELLTYFGVLAILMTVAWLTFYRCMGHTVGVNAACENIARALHAGELWRKDIRHATAAPYLQGDVLHIPASGGEVLYRHDGKSALRKAPSTGKWQQVLRKTFASRMVLDPGANVQSWRWEVELASEKGRRTIRPLFSFQAVPGFGRSSR